MIKKNKDSIENLIKTVEKIIIKNVEAYEIIKFKEYEDLSKNHFIRFIKLENDHIPDEEILHSIFGEWPKPKVIISINGGIENINLTKEEEKHLKQTFKNFLIADNQWFIGNGLNCGIHKLVSEIVQESRFEDEDKQISLIGFCDFSNIEDNQSVFMRTKKKQERPVHNLKLDPHYNCLIFHELNDWQEDKELQLRSNFERYCSKFNAFTFQIVWGEDISSLNWLINSLENQIYIVVMKGSGKMAEIICNILNRIESANDLMVSLQEEFDSFVVDLNSSQIDTIREFRKQILIYNIKCKTERLDKQIFNAIKSSLEGDLEKILLLSMSFKEDIIKETGIFKHIDFVKFTKEQQRNVLKSILKNNKPILLKLFLENEISVNELLEVNDLYELYEESINGRIGCTKLLKAKLQYMKNIYSSRNDKKSNNANNQDGVDQLDSSKGGIFGRTRKKPSDAGSKKLGKLGQFLPQSPNAGYGRGKAKKEYYLMQNCVYRNKDKCHYVTSQNVFIWALLSGNFEIAFIIWKEGNNQLSTALKGSIILKDISQDLIDLSQLSQNYLTESQSYRDIAIQMMTEIFNESQSKASSILLRPINCWDNMSCLQIAMTGDVKEFCNLNACLSFTKRAWIGKLSPKMKSRDSFLNINGQKVSAVLQFQNSLKRYFHAPISKFVTNLIAYILFLLCFMDVNLFRLKPIDSYRRKYDFVTEIYVYLYCIVFIIEEINQFVNQERKDFKSKLKSYFSGPWNTYDCILIILFLISGILRGFLLGDYFMIVRCLYAIILAMFWIRSMQFFLISRVLGPKIVIIKKMIIDVLFFFFIFLIFIVAYGSLVQSLQQPNGNLTSSVIRDILHKPYFHVYGELMLDEYRDSQCNSISCQIRDQTIIVAFGLYLLMTSVLLVNLLIAMFGHTFQEIQQDVANHFSVLQLQLLEEFHKKIFFFPPIIIIDTLYLIVQLFIGKKLRRNILVDRVTCDTMKLMEFEKSFIESAVRK